MLAHFASSRLCVSTFPAQPFVGLFFMSTPDKSLIAAKKFSDFCFLAKQPSGKLTGRVPD
jgi:hypothetical protein